MSLAFYRFVWCERLIRKRRGSVAVLWGNDNWFGFSAALARAFL